MTEVIYLPSAPTPSKPRYNEPCNGCGWCFHISVCKIGQHFFGKDIPAPCPAMTFESGIIRCGIVIAERELLNTDDIGVALGIGKGCCSDDLEKITHE